MAKPFRNSHSGLKKSSHGGVLTFVGASGVPRGQEPGEMLGVTWPSYLLHFSENKSESFSGGHCFLST